VSNVRASQPAKDVTTDDRVNGYFDSAHVHLNQPGRTSWEGFTSGTLAAISGGVTTVIDMPLNSIPSTTSVGALEVKIKAARYGWENWKSLEAAQKLLGGDAGDNLDLKSGMGIGAGWGHGRVDEKEMHDHENPKGTVSVDEALTVKGYDPDEGDEAMAQAHGDDPASIKRFSRRDSHSKERLLDILGPAESFVGENKGVYCDVGFWGGIVPGNREHLSPLIRAGVKGFKCFLIESGVDVSRNQLVSIIKCARDCRLILVMLRNSLRYLKRMSDKQ
jgi:dihydroorotase-like cyclic amidohydrolase